MFTPVWQLSVTRNRLRLTDTKSGKTIERSAVHPFSIASKLVANSECLEQEFLALARQMPRSFFSRYPLVEVGYPQDELEAEDREALRRAILDRGAAKVTLPG